VKGYAYLQGHGSKPGELPSSPHDDGQGGIRGIDLDVSAKAALNNAKGQVLLRKDAEGVFRPA
jgi:hypothetical protein